MSEFLKKASNTRMQQAAPEVMDTVAAVIADVRDRGDAAVREYSERFDGWSPANFKLSEADIERIVAQVPRQVIDDIRTVQANVRTFAQHQKDSLVTSKSRRCPVSSWDRRTSPSARRVPTSREAATRWSPLHT